MFLKLKKKLRGKERKGKKASSYLLVHFPNVTIAWKKNIWEEEGRQESRRTLKEQWYCSTQDKNSRGQQLQVPRKAWREWQIRATGVGIRKSLLLITRTISRWLYEVTKLQQSEKYLEILWCQWRILRIKEFKSLNLEE